MNYRSRATGHDQAAVRTLRERRDGALDLAGIAHIGHAQVHAEGRRRSLDDAELARSGRDGRVSKDRSPRHVGAISLSSSSHFAAMLYSYTIKPVALPPGRARLST